MTAVEWLTELLMNGYTIDNKIITQAKAMEKEQIIEAWHNGYDNQSPMIDEENCGQQYYNETFKSE
jgi:hypothetical protein